MFITIKPTSSASLKIKNRIREWGNVWEVIIDSQFNGEAAFLLRSVSIKNNEQDIRWIKKKDIEIIE